MARTLLTISRVGPPKQVPRLLFLISFLPASFACLFLARPASAQCLPLAPGFQDISLEPGNPFQAEYSVTMTPPPLAGFTLQPPLSPSSVARDSQGRVRVQRSAGKYKVKSADGAETEADRIVVSICDSVTRNSIQLDSVNKTATVQGPRISLPSGLPAPSNPRLPFGQGNQPKQSFCTRLFDIRRRFQNMQIEDLGHQLISGFEAQGLRTRSGSSTGPDANANSSSSYNDLWCSDELGAVLLHAFVTGGTNRHETLLQNIVRREPDPSLFQIPSDYAILQREDKSASPVRP